ncbi:MAG TPA: decarboxylating 6-phosphogluconate dehydrogenase [Patescibacteria group bacterium]|nr:decarboxylating 6-phosphogluconate dehydrogenase [Patescibacteria group bacterium]
MKVGIVGLGKMGSRLARKLHKDKHQVIVWNRTKEDILELQKEVKVKSAQSLDELVQKLDKPRVIWIMVPHKAFDEVISSINLEKNDILIDGGNSYYKDTEKRYKNFKNKGIRFLGIGVSGGVHGEENGYSLMVGGDKSAYEYAKPILETLSSPNGAYDYFGEGGAGHFVKMVHNGIEYGMMQSIGEGFEVLEKSKYKINPLKIAKVYQKGTIISGFLMDRTAEALTPDPKLKNVVGEIAATGEAEWTVEAAKEEGVKVEIIESSLNFRKKSKIDKEIKNSFTAKLVAALRNAFGGHEVKKK